MNDVIVIVLGMICAWAGYKYVSVPKKKSDEMAEKSLSDFRNLPDDTKLDVLRRNLFK